MLKILNKYKWLLLAIFSVVFIISVPSIVPNHYLRIVLGNGLVYVLAVYGLVVMLGMGGQVTFSTAGMMGIGAFLTGIFTVKLGLNSVLALVCSVILTGLFSLFIGAALLKLRGNYFAFASIAFTQVLYMIFRNWKPVTGGPDGISNIPALDLGFIQLNQQTVMEFIYFIFGLALICGLLLYRVRKTSLGRSLESVRDDEIAANSLGVDVYRTKIIAFIIASMLAALAGSLFAFLNGYVSSETFTFEQAGIYLIMAMLGGINSTVGSFIGTITLTILPEVLRDLKDYFRFIYGIVVIITMIFMPMGFAGLVKSLLTKLDHKFKKKKEIVTTGEVDTNGSDS
ncbi:MAG TPA: branched-chain amino acid ABC transporter permease [Clostridiaceae bacterium]|nr:branched-chain amino acid ABC transporter permease [Clostridiaceae bacterium]